jgi:hypothetical protein
MVELGTGAKVKGATLDRKINLQPNAESRVLKAWRRLSCSRGMIAVGVTFSL